jgi:purine-cytosine permease-like protein
MVNIVPIGGELGCYRGHGGIVHADAFTEGDSWVAKAQRIAGKFNIERRGIERVPEDKRKDTNGATSVGTMWLSANMVVPSFAIGALATPVLGFVDTILTIFFINMLGITPVSFFSTFDLASPASGVAVLSVFSVGVAGAILGMAQV